MERKSMMRVGTFVVFVLIIEMCPASSPPCKITSEMDALKGTWQGFVKNSGYQRPFHLEIDEGCQEKGGCVLIIGRLGTIEGVYRNIYSAKVEDNGGIQIVFENEDSRVILKGRFHMCSAIGGYLAGGFYPSARKKNEHLLVYAVKAERSIFSYIKEFNDKTKEVLENRE